MFNREEEGYLDGKDFSEHLHRFENDEYLTKYLVRCFNPEFKIRYAFPKDKPEFSLNGGLIGGRKTKFDNPWEVF